MKKTSFQPVRHQLLSSALITVFLAILVILSSCRKDRLTIDRIPHDKGTSSVEKYSIANVLPPKPDTHYVSRTIFENYSEMEVNYDASSMAVEKSAKLMGQNDEILSIAKVESFGKPDMISNKPAYHMKAVFQLDKTANQSMLKVTLPNSASVPDNGNEIFYIKIN